MLRIVWQKIDRILEAWSIAFWDHLGRWEKKNRNLRSAAEWINDPAQWMQDSGTLHILAFSAVMLNTDAHNPAMKQHKRMTKEQFLRNNRGIDGGRDVPARILEEIYDDIVQNQIVTVTEREDENEMLFTNASASGWMEKRGMS